MNEKLIEKAGQKGLSATFLFLGIAFCVCLIVSNIFVPRTWQVGSWPFQLTAGVLIFPVSYIINDCLTEVYGYRKAHMVIWMGFVMSAFVALASHLATRLPMPMFEEAVPAARNFDSLFAMVPRTTIASLIAFVIGSTANALVMSRMKVATDGRGFYSRAVISSVVGESLDSLIFFPIVFWGFMPWQGIVTIMVTQVVVKTLYEVLILPVTSFVVTILKKIEGLDTFDTRDDYKPWWLRKK